MSATARGDEVKPVTCVEDLEIKNPDKSKWESWCGKYETDPEDDTIDEVFIKDGELDNAESLSFHLAVGFEETNRIICFKKKL